MRGSNGGGSFKIEHGSDAAEITNLHKAGAEFGEVVGEKETRIKRKPKLQTKAAASIWFEIWGSWIRVKNRFFQANFRKISIFVPAISLNNFDFWRQISEKFRFFKQFD